MKNNILACVCFLSAYSPVLGQISSLTYGRSMVGIRGANLLLNGSFEQCTRPSNDCAGAYWAASTSKTPTTTIQHWIATGGGTKTYASIYDNFNPTVQPPPVDGHFMVYGGSGDVNCVPLPVFNIATGEATFSSTPVITHPDPRYGSPDPGLHLRQDVSVAAGHTFLLCFAITGEDILDQSTLEGDDGFFRLDIADGTDTYTKYMVIPGARDHYGFRDAQHPWMYYSIVFRANTSAIAVTFTNYGHVYSSGAQPVQQSTEMFIDDVVLNDISATILSVQDDPLLSLEPITNGVRLRWTCNEQTVVSYTAERSTDGLHFVSIGTIPAQHLSSYSLTDPGNRVGKSYYRLVTVSSDGWTRESRIVVYDGDFRRATPFLENRGSSDNVRIHQLTNGAAQLLLYNMSGALLMESNMMVADGTIQIPTGQLPPGAYLIKVIQGTGFELFRFMRN